MFPLLLQMRNRLAVVIGGGPVGQRKAAALLAADAQVRQICLEPRSAELHSPRLDWRCEPYRPEHLEGAALVFAAATPAVNAQVVADAHARGLWVNSADAPEAGDFHVPAVVQWGDFLLTISTGGAAPALARRIREKLEADFDEAFAAWVALLAELRPIIVNSVADPNQRRQLFEELSNWPWLDRLRSEGVASVRQAMLQRMDALVDRRDTVV